MGLLNAERVLRFMDRILVELEPSDFIELAKASKDKSVVIHSVSRKLLSKEIIHRYIIPLQGVLFFCRCNEELKLPEDVKVVNVKGLEYPGM